MSPGRETPEGRLAGDGSKAAPWHTSYHDVEHGLVNFLLLSLYVNQEPVTLHFRFEPAEAGRRFVSLVDDPRVPVKSVTVNGEPERVKGSWEERFERRYGFWRGLAGRTGGR